MATADDDDRTRIAEPADDRTRISPRAAAAATAEDDDPVTTPNPKTGIASAPQKESLGHNAFEVGQRIGEFEILDLIGEGGFGIVYLAYDHSLDRKVALKEYMPSALAHREEDGVTVVMRSDRHAETFAAGLRSFINEARLLAQFDHHSLVKVYRFWEANGTAYMVMPFYEGITLKQALKDLGTPPTEEWLKTLLAHLLDALEVIHNRQCYHRDVAPDNVLMQPDGTPLLLDFGAARRVIGDMTQALTVILKPGYAPIEQYAEVPNMKQGPWTDIYALASVAFFAMTGKAPVPSVARVMSDPLKPLAETMAGRYSEEFLKGIDWGLAVKPEDRPQTIADFRQALGIAEHEPTTRYIARGQQTPASERTVVIPSAPASAQPQPAPAAAAPAPAAASPEAAPGAPAAAPAAPAAPVTAPAKSNKPLFIGAGVAALLALGAIAFFMSGERAPEQQAQPQPPQPKVEIAPEPAQKAASSAPADVVAAVNAKLAAMECARLEANVDGGTALVKGHVAAESDLKRIPADLKSIKGIARVDAEGVQLVPPSYCGVVLALAPYVKEMSALPTIALKGGQSAAYEGDKLVTEVTNANFAGFIYADLYDTDGNVVHMLPNSRDKRNEAKPRQRSTIGEDGVFGQQWDIVPPFGKHLLVIVSSKVKLFDRERPEMEPAFKYVGALSEALKKNADAVAVNYTFVDFAPKK